MKSCVVVKKDVHDTIVHNNLFQPGDKVAIGASGGKDSTVLAHVVKILNERHHYGLELILLSIDEGITGYRDDSLKAVERNRIEYGLPLLIVSYKELYGWTMDEIVTKIGQKNNCTFCGVFRRQALDRGAFRLGAGKLLTGHNADDMAETVLLNVLRGDVARLDRNHNLQYCYEKDIVMYARVNNLDYFYTECIYAPNSYRAFARTFVKTLERTRPRAIMDLIRSGEAISIKKDVSVPTLGNCHRCGYISSQALCKACLLLEGLASNNVSLGVKKQKKTDAVGGGCGSKENNGGCDCSEENAELAF